MRLYIVKETNEAYLLKGTDFKERWVPKKAVIIKQNSERLGIDGVSKEMTIELWALK